VQTDRCVGLLGNELVQSNAHVRVSNGHAVAVVGLPDQARTGHAEGVEHVFLGQVFHGSEGDRFDHVLQKKKAFSRIGEVQTGLEQDGKLRAGVTEVREAGCV